MVSALRPGYKEKYTYGIIGECLSHVGGTFVRVGQHSDGSCFYHSIASCVLPTEWDTSDLKKKMDVGHVFRRKMHSATTRHKWNSFWTSQQIDPLPDYYKAKKAMSQVKTWADIITISYTAAYMGLNILFVDDNNGQQLYCGVTNPGKDNENPTVLVLWVGGTHFEAIWWKAEGDSTYTRTFPKEHPVAKNISREYANSCAGISLASRIPI